LAGWHLPYCRVFNSELTDCFWDQKYEQRSSAAASPLQAAIDETRMLFETTMFSAFGTSLVATRHAEEFAALLSATRRYVADPAIAFTFVHFNIPHTPYFYNSTTGHLGRSGYSPALYDDTLQLVDSAIGEICRSLARSGLASKTAIVLSADHPARFPTRIDHGQDPHVPFLVYLPGESVGLLSDYEFSTLQSKDLVMAIARGEVKSPAEVASFFGPSTSTR
jgi:membrane-anchored protein YejM (alkaline phosphatase superfamily)